MSRIRPLEPEDWDPALRAAVPVEVLTPIQLAPIKLFANHPGTAAAIGGFSVAIAAGRTLPERLVELVRLRIAFHNQCRSCMAIRYQTALDDGLGEELVCSLEKPHDAPDLTDAERAALAYADRFATDHLSIGDAVYDDLRCHFSESEIVQLGAHCAFCVGFGRLMATFHMVEDLPEGFRIDGPIAPSAAEPLLVG